MILGPQFWGGGNTYSFDKLYTQLEYIQSTGTQYIDTGYIPSQDTRLDMVAMSINVSDAADGSGFIPYGSAVSYNSQAFELYSTYSQYEFNYGTQYVFLASAASYQMLTISHDKNSISIDVDGTEYTSTLTYETFTAPYTLTLFATHRSSVLKGGYQRIYSCQIYDNETLIRDFIPVKRKADSEIGLYDKVMKAFFDNAGTGEFIAGPEITS